MKRSSTKKPDRHGRTGSFSLTGEPHAVRSPSPVERKPAKASSKSSGAKANPPRRRRRASPDMAGGADVEAPRRGRPVENLPDAADEFRSLVESVLTQHPRATHREMLEAFNKHARNRYSLPYFRAWLAPAESKLHRRFSPKLVERASARFKEVYGVPPRKRRP
jgi:hypothetical protein